MHRSDGGGRSWLSALWNLLSQYASVPVLSSLRRLRLFLYPRTSDGAGRKPTPDAEAARQLFLKIKLLEELWNVERKQSMQKRFDLVLTSFSKLPGTLDQRRKFAKDFQDRLNDNEVRGHHNHEGIYPDDWKDEIEKRNELLRKNMDDADLWLHHREAQRTELGDFGS